MSLANALEIETFKKVDDFVKQVKELPATMDKSIAPKQEDVDEAVKFYTSVQRQLKMMFTKYKIAISKKVAPAVNPFKTLEGDVKKLMDLCLNRLKKLRHEPTEAEIQYKPQALPASYFAQKGKKSAMMQGTTNGMPIHMIPTTNLPQILASSLFPPKIKPPTKA